MSMEEDDRKNLYEVTELEDFDKIKSYQPNDPPFLDEKGHQSFALGKFGVTALIAIALFLFLALVILLGVTVVTLTHLKTLPICDNSIASASSSTSGGSSTGQNLPNCSIIYSTWANELSQNNTMLQSQVNQLNAALQGKMQQQVSQILNTTKDTADKVNDLHNFADDQTISTQNVTDRLQQVLETTGNSALNLINIVNTLSNLKETGTSTAGVVNDILQVVQELFQLQNGSSSSFFPTSCQQIMNRNENSPSGVYLLAHPDGTGVSYTYCQMGELCGSGGGWTRLAYIDMSDSTENCPSEFRLYQSGGVRACGRPISSVASCASVQFPSNGISYSQICGRVVGYQYGSPDAADGARFDGHNDLNSYYIDGVSITKGSPRQHVWSLIAGLFENTPSSIDNCPCSTGSSQTIQAFVGNNYFCESGRNSNLNNGPFYSTDPLWDGQNCGAVETLCCSASGLPWFHRDYGNTLTTDNLELRVCGDESTANEDVPFSYYEIYVK